ncbi:hypothetical protein GGTG_03218 [Gaeumannomyces tritici R3-111a-1]|uniref:Uncharacterized protein n=1 Tax=Gaeumannomyces tritici (strain R3-111a-1) TaxID=644352 RepID=J3NPL0_GAET3|nr:hypothetical protein GGTG_03218 [Gaeumannomyces tritici R3-111a-1]EJT78115.1 hypothetical protein GGTG_03218 [Gaeumannomyces tritici R3-111a-1]
MMWKYHRFALPPIFPVNTFLLLRRYPYYPPGRHPGRRGAPGRYRERRNRRPHRQSGRLRIRRGRRRAAARPRDEVADEAPADEEPEQTAPRLTARRTGRLAGALTRAGGDTGSAAVCGGGRWSGC